MSRPKHRRKPNGPERPGRRAHIHNVLDHVTLPHVRFSGGPLDQCTVALTETVVAERRWPCPGGAYRPERGVWTWKPS